MNNKTIILMLGILLVLPMVMAADPSFTFISGEPVDIKLPVFFSDNQKSDASINCFITIKDSNDLILVDDAAMTFNASGYFNYTLTNTTDLGMYPTVSRCDNSVDFGFTSFTIEINPTGSVMNTSRSIIYFLFLMAIMGTFCLCLWGAFVTPWRNQRDEEGLIISVNDLKYLKVFLIALSYILLMWIFGIVRSITANFLILPGVTKIFNYLFVIMFSALFPIMVVSLIMFFIVWVESKKIKDTLERGLPVQ